MLFIYVLLLSFKYLSPGLRFEIFRNPALFNFEKQYTDINGLKLEVKRNSVLSDLAVDVYRDTIDKDNQPIGLESLVR